MEFVLSTSDQVDSRLIWLPTELRTKILRLLLRTSEPLPTSTAYGTEADLQLSSQILQCCQILHDEAHRILYKENTLSIDCTSDLPVQALVLLDCVVYLPLYPLLYAESVTDLVSAAYSDAQNNPAHQAQYERCSRVIPSVSKFEQMYINFEPAFDSLEEISSTCRLLRTITARKRIKVNLPKLDSSTGRFDAWIKCFQWWRCESIEFCGLPNAMTKSVISVITGSDPVFDLYPGVNILQEIFESISIQAYGIRSYDAGAEQYLAPPEWFDWSAYQYYAHHNDVGAFENMADCLTRWKQLVTDRAVEKISKDIDREIADIEPTNEEDIAKVRLRVDDEVTELRKQANEINDKVARIKALIV